MTSPLVHWMFLARQLPSSEKTFPSDTLRVVPIVNSPRTFVLFRNWPVPPSAIPSLRLVLRQLKLDPDWVTS